jgi:hypothetical protein
MAGAGELVNSSGVITVTAVLHDDQQAMASAGEVLVDGVHRHNSRQGGPAPALHSGLPSHAACAALLTDPSLFAGRLRRLSGTGNAVPTAGEPVMAGLVPGERLGRDSCVSDQRPDRGVTGAVHKHRRPSAFSVS